MPACLNVSNCKQTTYNDIVTDIQQRCEKACRFGMPEELRNEQLFSAASNDGKPRPGNVLVTYGHSPFVP
jgi:hypothetical protein